jgi:6-phosphogluconate dehydrogenase
MMVPSGDPVDETIAKLKPLMQKGDIFIDGGNSNYKDTQRRHDELKKEGFEFVDTGTSGGIWGITEGYSMMVGGDEDVVEHLRPIYEALAPSPTTGWGRVGPSGSGHFVKMIHNGIEYGMMEAYAEGFSIMKAKQVLWPGHDADRGDLALRFGGAFLAAGPDRRRAEEEPEAGGSGGFCAGLRRGPLDGV